MSRPLRATLLTSAEELGRLRAEWDSLYDRCPQATPFQSYGWLMAWWTIFGRSDAVVVAVTRHECLVAVAPLYVVRDPHGLRHLRLIGHGHSDYPDLLIADDDPAATMAEIWDALKRIKWHVGMFTDLREASPLLIYPPPAQFVARVTPHGVAPCLALPSDIEVFRNNLPRGLRRTLRRCRTRLDALGPMTCEQVPLNEAEFMLDVLFELHTAQWRRRGRPGVFAEPRVRDFHRLAVRSLSRSGVLRLWALRSNGTVVGVKYTLWRRDCVWSYISGIDDAYRPLSVGAIFFEDVIARAIAAGCTQFDFLRGAESYKYVWGARDQQLFALAVARA